MRVKNMLAFCDNDPQSKPNLNQFINVAFITKGHSHGTRLGCLVRMRTKPQRHNPVTSESTSDAGSKCRTNDTNLIHRTRGAYCRTKCLTTRATRSSTKTGANATQTHDPSSSREKNKQATYWARWSDVSIALARLRNMRIWASISSAFKKGGKRARACGAPAATERRIRHSWMKKNKVKDRVHDTRAGSQA